MNVTSSWTVAMAHVRLLLSDGQPHSRESIIREASRFVASDDALEASRMYEYWDERRKMKHRPRDEYSQWLARHSSPEDYVPQRGTREQLITSGVRYGLMARINHARDIEVLRSHATGSTGRGHIVMLRKKGDGAVY